MLDADSVYWTGFASAPGVLKAPLDGSGAAMTLASLPSSAMPVGNAIAVDATNVYYVISTTGGGNPTPTSTFYKVAK